MIRKLIKQGNTSLVVSLPIEWIRSQKLKGGDKIEINNKDNKIIINVPQDETIKRHNLNVESLDELAVYINLLNLYRKGFDEIRIISNSKKIINYETNKKINTLESIKKWLPRFIGWEITTQDPIIIKDITGESTENPEKLLQRVFFILNTFVDEEIAAINNKSLMPNAHEFYMTTFKLINYSIRTYNKRPTTSHTIILLQQLHKIAQILRDIQPHLKNNSKVILPILSLLRPALKLYTKGDLSSFVKPHYIEELKINKLKVNNDLLRMLISLHDLYTDLMYSINFLKLEKNN